EVVAQQLPERLLGRAVRRPVVVRQVEVRDPEVERPPDDRAATLERRVGPEVLPEPERERRELEPAPAAAAVLHLVVAAGRREVHGRRSYVGTMSRSCSTRF